MRRVIFLILGLLELAIAFVLLMLGSQLPDRDEVERGFRGAERVTQNAGTHARILRRQVQDLRRPELQKLAGRVQKQTTTVTALMREQQIDYNSVRAMRDALNDAAVSLDELSGSLDGKHVKELADGLGRAADFLEQRALPAAGGTADRLEAAARDLRADSERLGVVLRAAPLDLKAARELYESLGRFDDGLGKMNSFLKADRFDAMRDGFRGMETALGTGAEQVERLAGYTYPVVEFKGVKPEVDQKKFWPEGEKIAEGMRKAQSGVAAAGKEFEGLGSDLPKLRTSLDESRKIVRKTREALGTALEQQAKIEPVLKDMPARANRLLGELPKLADDLAKLLRDTDRIKQMAASLRQVQKGLDTAVAHWPELQQTLKRSAGMLRATRGQLDRALDHRKDYEAALNQSTSLAESFASLLPLLTDQLDTRLDEEENALTEMELSLGEVQSALPVYARTTQHVFAAGRWLSWLMAAIAGLHAAYLLLSVRLGRRFSL